MTINWERFAERTTGVVCRLKEKGFGEFMLIDTTPFYAQEHALSACDMYGRFLGDSIYKSYQGWHEENTVHSSRLRVEVLDQSSFHRMVDAVECEYFIDGQWLTFEQVMANDTAT